jgi:transposase
MTIPGLGPVTASPVATSVQDVSAFLGPREFAAFLGLTPRQNSSGGKERLGRISIMGNRYLRKLLVVGAHAVLYHRKPHEDALRSIIVVPRLEFVLSNCPPAIQSRYRKL